MVGCQSSIMDERLGQYAEVFKALGDPTRLRILKLLAQRGETCVCEIVPALNMPQSTVSHHLATLKRAGLIAQRKESQMIFYALIDEENTRQAIRFLDRVLEKVEKRTLARAV